MNSRVKTNAAVHQLPAHYHLTCAGAQRSVNVRSIDHDRLEYKEFTLVDEEPSRAI